MATCRHAHSPPRCPGWPRRFFRPSSFLSRVSTSQRAYPKSEKTYGGADARNRRSAARRTACVVSGGDSAVTRSLTGARLRARRSWGAAALAARTTRGRSEALARCLAKRRRRAMNADLGTHPNTHLLHQPPTPPPLPLLNHHRSLSSLTHNHHLPPSPLRTTPSLLPFNLLEKAHELAFDECGARRTRGVTSC